MGGDGGSLLSEYALRAEAMVAIACVRSTPSCCCSAGTDGASALRSFPGPAILVYQMVRLTNERCRNRLMGRTLAEPEHAPEVTSTAPIGSPPRAEGMHVGHRASSTGFVRGQRLK